MSAGRVVYICHPHVVIDPDVPVPRWPLNAEGRAMMHALVPQMVGYDFESIWSSDEQKALDGAQILANAVDAPHMVEAQLGENDRTATGYLPQEAFDVAVEAFFGAPETSYRGWETARHARDRMVTAVRDVLGRAPAGDLAIVAHGGVGALLNGWVKGVEISRATASKGYGSWFSFDRAGWDLITDWV